MRALLGSQKSQLSPIKFKLDLIVIVVELRYSGSPIKFKLDLFVIVAKLRYSGSTARFPEAPAQPISLISTLLSF